jgi:hypothetical protein
MKLSFVATENPAMPRLAELQKQIKHSNRPSTRADNEEVLIADLRGQMRPGDFVEQKLQVALQTSAIVQTPSRTSYRGLPK